MTITTEEAERLADRLEKDAESSKGARYQPYTDSAMRDASTALRSLAAERDALQAERDGANALVERMHEQDLLAIKAWQAAHPGSELTWPSSARLSAWCMGEVASVTAERDALKAENARLREALDELLRCTEKHVFGDECKVQRDKARAALGETQ